jgi:hypothetical protein
MRFRLFNPLIGILFFGTPLPLAAAVEVTFVEPETYTDAAYRAYQTDRSPVLKMLREHLESLGLQYLPSEQQLKIDILDIDLAGRFEPWRYQGYDVRYLRDITWPRIKLQYTLLEDGQVISNADVALSDMNYLQHGNRYFHSDRLRYEKRLLDDWFRKEFKLDRTN